MARIQTRRAPTVRKPLNVQMNRFVSKVITPVVLVAGLLMLILLHFRGVLSDTTTQDALFKGQQSFSSGSLQYTFTQNAGGSRPSVSFGGANVLTWVEWSSTISVDGNVSNLWDNYHGYDDDTIKRQVFSTITGTGFQVVEIVTLVDAHTVTVQYELVARNQGTEVPHAITLTIEHTHKTLYQPAISGTTLSAGVLAGSVSNLSGSMKLRPIGTLTFSVSGKQLVPNGISIEDLQGNVTANGTQQSIATAFTTTYVTINPTVDKLIPLGTETLTYSSASGVGTPYPSIVTTATP